MFVNEPAVALITTKKRHSLFLVSLLIISLISFSTPLSSASEIVQTDAQQIVNGGSQADRMMALDADSEGNVHVVWSRNSQHLYYKMLDPRGEPLIGDTQISDPGQHRAWHPDIRVDNLDRVHIVWTDKAGQYSIKYTILDPSLDDQDGGTSLDSVLSILNQDYVVASNPQNRDWPAIDVDSNNNPHIVWEDSYEPLEKFYAQPQIYYKMISIDSVARVVITEIDSTLLTPILGHKAHPDIAVDVNDIVQIVWDDTRGGTVEMVVPIDTSGSMDAEWADMCVIFYGGNFFSGGYFPGLKPLLLTANMTVYETLYAIGGGFPGSAQSGSCSTAYQTGGSGSQGPRNTALGLNPGDDSGGIRKLTEAIYNGQAITLSDDGWYDSEHWGPATAWACLSWTTNPPTQADHVWNPNATRIVIPISDEGPYGGSSEMNTDDTQTINEAHDDCVEADTIPSPLWAGSETAVGSFMQDLAQCPNGQGLNARSCNGRSVRLTNAGGQMYSFPTSSTTASELELMVEHMVYLSTNNTREIYMTVLDPLSLLENPWPGWVRGDSGTEVNTALNTYTEDLGPSSDENGYGHLVVVNDTRITTDDAYSLHPAIAVDNSGNTHLAWQDGRIYGRCSGVGGGLVVDSNYEIYYSRLRLRSSAVWDGVSEGLPTFGIKQIADSAISNVEGCATGEWPIEGNRWGASSVFPSILTDMFDNVHLAWLDYSNVSAGETVVYTRLNHTKDTYPDGFPLNSIASSVLDPWTLVEVTNWSSDKLGPPLSDDPLRQLAPDFNLDIGMPPALANDLGSGAHVGWSDENKCNEDKSTKYTLCYVHILTGLVDVSVACDNTILQNPNIEGYPYDCPNDSETFYHTIYPGDLTTFNMTISNPTPGPEELVKDKFKLVLDGIPNNWSATLLFVSNNTPIYEDTKIFLNGGQIEPIYIKIRAPTIYQAKADELAQISVTAISYKDPAIRNQQLLLTLMDVVHGIELDTSHFQVDVEQGKSAVFSISVKNTGNVYDTFAFYDPSTLEGQNEWAIPFGWGIDFPTSLSLDPGQSVTRNLKVSIPESQDPGTFVIYLKGWSTGEPILSIDRGTFDVLELWINVSIRTTGNIVFQIGDTMQYVLPGECSYFPIAVTKHFSPGHLVFTTPGAPDERPEEFDELLWKFDHWTIDLDFSEAPGGNGPPDNSPRYWSQIDTPRTVTAEMCAPFNSTAGLGKSITVRAHLDGTPKVRDSVVILTNVIQEYELEAAVPETILDLYPGQSYQMDTSIENTGNGPDRYDVSITSIVDSNGESHVWDIDIPRVLFQELDRDETQIVPIFINVPEKTLAGEYTLTFNVLSEEEFEGTRIQDEIVLNINVIEFHDMRITLDPAVESKIKTTAPSRIVRFTLNVTNFGNVPDQPTLHNHTKNVNDVWTPSPGLNTLNTWKIDFALLEGFRTEFPEEKPCLELKVGDNLPQEGCFITPENTVTLPIMDAYTTIQIVVIITIAPDAALQDRLIGIKTLSMHGSSDSGGDFDETPLWDDSCTLDENKDGIQDNFPPNCDDNEQVLELRLRAPDLKIIDVQVSSTSAEIGEMLSVNVKVVNHGNAHSTDVNIILCKDQDPADIKRNGCDESNIVYRQIVKAIMPTPEQDSEDPNSITLLYMVEPGSHDIVVVVDPDNNIVETDETNNIQSIPGGKMKSPLGAVDSAVDVVARYSVSTIILGATISLVAVAGFVIYARRIEALDRFAELSSLMPGKDDDDIRF